MESILVPFDGSEQAEGALRFALKNYEGTEVVVLHVIDPVGKGGGKEVKAAWWGMWYENREKRADEILEQAKEVAKEEDREIITETMTGKPTQTIIEYAKDRDVDKIVMGRQGETGMKRVLLGSVAENVMRHSDLPVTLVGETSN